MHSPADRGSHAVETIISGLIAAVASVVVAFIARMPPPSASGSSASALRAVRAHQKYLSPAWLVTAVVIVGFAGLVPLLVHRVVADYLLFFIPVATLILAVASPINPLSAASITLALHAASIILGLLTRSLVMQQLNGHLVVQAAIFVTNAVVVGLICWWRRRSTPPVEHAIERPELTGDRIAALEKLARLKADGVLTQEEFDQEKRRILHGS
jgi:Short C-terminal domain